MATKTATVSQTDANDAREEGPDAPLLDTLGAELKIPLFAFRVGGYRDFAAADPHWAYSLGVGFGIPLISVDASVLLSPQGGIDPTDIDRLELGAGASVRLRF